MYGQGAGPAWSPDNGWMDAYSSSSSGVQQSDSSSDSTPAPTADYYEALQMATAATAAAGASSSGLSDFKDPLAAADSSSEGAEAGQGSSSNPTSAAVRAALLDEHGMALEQFGSLADALDALADREQQQAVVGLAEGDYDDQAWQQQ